LTGFGFLMDWMTNGSSLLLKNTARTVLLKFLDGNCFLSPL
jgi:hypothetical protein